ncbi:hypothetical protein CAEBREN_20654 [Caenorhabditis brenneri]|uniref:Galectin n=1 Tax=Caenorhabditis brenneri TaxID=135651 RepID=G0NMM7_CAEBE|nr:hypothetical protein CAEBREN_20654 [Caenorhabditis brenneri]
MMIFVLFLILASFPQFSQSRVTTYTHEGKHVLKNESRSFDVIQEDFKENYKNVFDSGEEFVHETDIPLFQKGDEIVIRLLCIGRFGIFLNGFKDEEKISLGISFRPDEQVIVFNSYMTSKWRNEEKLGVEIEPPKVLRISIKLQENNFMVTINHQLKIFYHRSVIVAGPMRVFFLGQVAIDEFHVVEKSIEQSTSYSKNGPVSNMGRDRTAPKTVKEQTGAKTKKSQRPTRHRNTTPSSF